MPLDYQSTLYAIAEQRNKLEEEERKKQEEAGNKSPHLTSQQAIALEDELQGVIV